MQLVYDDSRVGKELQAGGGTHLFSLFSLLPRIRFVKSKSPLTLTSFILTLARLMRVRERERERERERDQEQQRRNFDEIRMHKRT